MVRESPDRRSCEYKSIGIDGKISLFGSVNQYPRSFWLEFEVILCVNDTDFAAWLRTL